MDALDSPALEHQDTVRFFQHRAELAVHDFFGRSRPDLASDLAQDALLTAFEELGPESRIDNPGAWLRKVYRHRLIDMWRSERCRPDHVSLSSLRSLFSDPETNPVDVRESGSEATAENRILVSEALDQVRSRLDERQQQIFELGLYGLTQREIARILELSPASISAEVRTIEHVIRTLWPPDDGGGGSGGGSAGPRSTWLKRLHGSTHLGRTNGKGGGTMGHRFDREILTSMLPELGRLLCELPVFDDGAAGARAADPRDLAEAVARLAPRVFPGEPVQIDEPSRRGVAPTLFIGIGGTGCEVIQRLAARGLLVYDEADPAPATLEERSCSDPPAASLYHNLARSFDNIFGSSVTAILAHLMEKAAEWIVGQPCDDELPRGVSSGGHALWFTHRAAAGRQAVHCLGLRAGLPGEEALWERLCTLRRHTAALPDRGNRCKINRHATYGVGILGHHDGGAVLVIDVCPIGPSGKKLLLHLQDAHGELVGRGGITPHTKKLLAAIETVEGSCPEPGQLTEVITGDGLAVLKRRDDAGEQTVVLVVADQEVPF